MRDDLRAGRGRGGRRGGGGGDGAVAGGGLVQARPSVQLPPGRQLPRPHRSTHADSPAGGKIGHQLFCSFVVVIKCSAAEQHLLLFYSNCLSILSDGNAARRFASHPLCLLYPSNNPSVFCKKNVNKKQSLIKTGRQQCKYLPCITDNKAENFLIKTYKLKVQTSRYF